MKKGTNLAMIIDNRLSPENHINEKVRNISIMLTTIRVAFNYVIEKILTKIITSFIKPILQYVAIVWNPFMK